MKISGYSFIFVGLLNLVINLAWIRGGDRPNFYMRGGIQGFWVTTVMGAIFVIAGTTMLFLARRKR